MYAFLYYAVQKRLSFLTIQASEKKIEYCTLQRFEWVSEWMLFNANSAISWREQVNFQWDNDEVRFVLDQHTELDFYSASPLKQQWIDMSCHSDTLFRFQANQSLFFLLNAASLAEKQQIRVF